MMIGRVLAAAVVLLYVLHQDFWYWRDARPLLFGFLPIGLFYHAVFTLLVSAVMWALVKYAWPAELGDELADVDPSSDRSPDEFGARLAARDETQLEGG